MDNLTFITSRFWSSADSNEWDEDWVNEYTDNHLVGFQRILDLEPTLGIGWVMTSDFVLGFGLHTRSESTDCKNKTLHWQIAPVLLPPSPYFSLIGPRKRVTWSVGDGSESFGTWRFIWLSFFVRGTSRYFRRSSYPCYVPFLLSPKFSRRSSVTPYRRRSDGPLLITQSLFGIASP